MWSYKKMGELYKWVKIHLCLEMLLPHEECAWKLHDNVAMKNT